jgi:hypothetical protein
MLSRFTGTPENKADLISRVALNVSGSRMIQQRRRSISPRASTATRFSARWCCWIIRQPDSLDGFDVTMFPILNPNGLTRGGRANRDEIDLNRAKRFLINRARP